MYITQPPHVFSIPDVSNKRVSKKYVFKDISMCLTNVYLRNNVFKQKMYLTIRFCWLGTERTRRDDN